MEEGRAMNDAGTLPRHMLEVRELTPEAFVPYGQIVMPLKTGGQGAETGYDPETSTREAKLVLHNGEPRLWIMHLPHVGLGFSRIARHRRGGPKPPLAAALGRGGCGWAPHA